MVDDTLLDRLYFAGDPHGTFSPLNEVATAERPAAMILIGDYDLDCPLDEAVAPAAAATEIYWIHGNHDGDHAAYYTHLVDSGLADRCLHGRVQKIAGVRIAGLGGHFQGKIWHPHEGDGQPKFTTRQGFLDCRLPPKDRWRGGVRIKQRAAIWWEDVEALWDQRADILVTHEAPHCHPLGFQVIDDLAEAMGARIIVHGHHHVAYRFDHADVERTVIGLGLAGVSTGTGQVRAVGQIDYPRGTDLLQRHQQRWDRPAGRLQTIQSLLPPGGVHV